MRDKKERILAFSLERFMSSGYSGVTMEDISRGCGIGKATLYSCFPSKETLLLSCIDYAAKQLRESVSSILSDKALSPAEKLGRFFTPVARMLSRVNSAALEDIGRHLPEAWVKIRENQQQAILGNITKLLDEGKSTGIFKKDTDARLVAHILIACAAYFISPGQLAEFGQTPDKLMNAVISVLFGGCLTEYGKAQFS